MTAKSALHPAQIAALLAAAFAGVNWWFNPAEAGAWLAAMAAALSGVVIMAVVRARKDAAAVTTIGRAVSTAALIIGAALAVALAGSLGWMSGDIEDRVIGVVMGLVLITTGNLLPKTANRAQASACAPARRLAAERFAGWTLVVTGFAFTAVWVFAPIDAAPLGASLIGLGGVMVVLARCLALTRPARTHSS